MIGVDTNVLVRYIVHDHEAQAAAAAELLDARTPDSPAYLTLVTLCELVWVLTGAYRYSRTTVAQVLDVLLSSAEVVVESESVARQAAQLYEAGADFADAVIAEMSRRAGCAHVATFDRTASRVTGMRLLA